MYPASSNSFQDIRLPPIDDFKATRRINLAEMASRPLSFPNKDDSPALRIEGSELYDHAPGVTQCIPSQLKHHNLGPSDHRGMPLHFRGPHHSEAPKGSPVFDFGNPRGGTQEATAVFQLQTDPNPRVSGIPSRFTGTPRHLEEQAISLDNFTHSQPGRTAYQAPNESENFRRSHINLERAVPSESPSYIPENTMYFNPAHGNLEVSPWGMTKAGKPRKRLGQACTSCREKKIKCDPRSWNSKCIPCQKYGIECEFRTTSVLDLDRPVFSRRTAVILN